jgi:hypothetical protein
LRLGPCSRSTRSPNQHRLRFPDSIAARHQAGLHSTLQVYPATSGYPALTCGNRSQSSQWAPRRIWEPGRRIWSGHHSDSTSRQGCVLLSSFISPSFTTSIKSISSTTSPRGHFEWDQQEGYGGSHPGKIPKFDFPQFEGDHPKLWINLSSSYVHKWKSIIYVDIISSLFYKWNSMLNCYLIQLVV